MKRLAMVVMALVCGQAGNSIAQDRTIVAVFDVEAKGAKMDPGVIDRLTDYLCSLMAERGYQVVPRSQLKQRLSGQKKDSYKKCYDESCQIDVGKELSAQESLATQVIQLGGKCKVAITFYDLKKAASEKGKTVSGGCGEPQIVESLEKVVDQLVGAGAGQPPAVVPQPAPPVDKAALIWVKSGAAGIEFTKSEITVAQYRACAKAGKCVPAHFDDETCYDWDGQKWVQVKLPAAFQGDDQPVVCVDWNQAAAFCEWAGGRLPTEEEWYAEASNKGTRQYPWGDQEPTCDTAVMNQGGNGCGRGSTWPVCSKERGASVSGLCDMSGNVWEWTSTPDGSTRVLRGGSWGYDLPDGLRAAFRRSDPPFNGTFCFGFRCSRSFR